MNPFTSILRLGKKNQKESGASQSEPDRMSESFANPPNQCTPAKNEQQKMVIPIISDYSQLNQVLGFHMKGLREVTVVIISVDLGQRNSSRIRPCGVCSILRVQSFEAFQRFQQVPPAAPKQVRCELPWVSLEGNCSEVPRGDH